MHITKIVPKVTTYSIKTAPNDENNLYSRCLWANITLDYDSWTLSCIGDCGTWSYTWIPDNKGFLDLMCRVNRDYLLNKVASRGGFNLARSKTKTIDNIKEYYMDELPLEAKEAINYISDMDTMSADEFFVTIDGRYDWLDFEDVCIENDFPSGAETFCDIFIDYLQPILRQESKLESQGGVE